MIHASKYPIREELAKIEREQKDLNPHRSRIQISVSKLFAAHQRHLGSNVDQPSFDYVTNNHLCIGNIFPDFAQRLTITLRSAGLKAGTDFMVEPDESGKAMPGARKIIINKGALRDSVGITNAIDQSSKNLLELAAAKK